MSYNDSTLMLTIPASKKSPATTVAVSETLTKVAGMIAKDRKVTDPGLSTAYLKAFSKTAKLNYEEVYAEALLSGITVLDTDPTTEVKPGQTLDTEQSEILLMRKHDADLSDADHDFATDCLVRDFSKRAFLAVQPHVGAISENPCCDQDDLKQDAMLSYVQMINDESSITALLKGHNLNNRGIMKGSSQVLDNIYRKNGYIDKHGQHHTIKQAAVEVRDLLENHEVIDAKALAKKHHVSTEAIDKLVKNGGTVIDNLPFGFDSVPTEVETALAYDPEYANTVGSDSVICDAVEDLADKYLTETQKQIFFAKACYGPYAKWATSSIAKIANELGLKPSEVKKQLAEAVDTLQKGLALIYNIDRDDALEMLA